MPPDVRVGVQVVAYFDSLALDRDTFVGVLAMVLVGVEVRKKVWAGVPERRRDRFVYGVLLVGGELVLGGLGRL